MTKHQMLINGARVDAASGEWIESINPFTAKAWAMVPRAGAEDVNRAVAAARAAFYGPWSKLTATARGAMVHKLGDLIAVEANRLAEIESTDNGKLFAEMRGQLNYIPQWFHYFGGLADKIEGRVIPIDKPGCSTTRARSLSELSPRSRRGIRRCYSPRGNSRLRWQRATPSYGSPRSIPRCRRWCWRNCLRRLDSPSEW